MLWFLPNRRQENIARALLTGLIFQEGVPLIFRNDEAAELVAGTVATMNSYLGIQQVTTGARTQSPLKCCCRALHAAPNCLPDKMRRQPIRQHARLPSRNCVCPQHRVQLGHQLHTFRGWTRAPSSNHHGSARKPQAANNCRRGMDIDDADKNWEKSLFPKVCKLAERLASEEQRQTQWHKWMNAHGLKQAGDKTHHIS
jgi:hypothetical protein